jgi:hypothetical protein
MLLELLAAGLLHAQGRANEIDGRLLCRLRMSLAISVHRRAIGSFVISRVQHLRIPLGASNGVEVAAVIVVAPV